MEIIHFYIFLVYKKDIFEHTPSRVRIFQLMFNTGETNAIIKVRLANELYGGMTNGLDFREPETAKHRCWNSVL